MLAMRINLVFVPPWKRAGRTKESYLRQLEENRRSIPGLNKVRNRVLPAPESTIIDDEHGLPMFVRLAIERADALMAVESGTRIQNPDLWSENDERSLMAIGCLDGHEPKRQFDTAWNLDGTTFGVSSHAGTRMESAIIPKRRWARR